MDLTLLVPAGATALLLVLVQALRRHRRQRRGKAALLANERRAVRVPLTLHPVIDPNICIGSLSCLKACPEGDILGVIDGAARLIHADHCIGHGRCEAECPVDAIKLVFGTQERGIDLPMVDEFFESSRPGVHIVGELGGMGLIKNAVTQGLQVAERLAHTLPAACSGAATDVVVVGAGPAGLATALGLRAAGRSFRILEQGSVGGTMAHYPRQKVVMTEPIEVPYFGKLRKKQIAKEELIATWTSALQKAKVQVEEGVKVMGIEGRDGAFELRTSRGSVAASKVVLATGLRGSPRKLGVPGEELPKVAYRLTEPEQYEGCRVLVVGGGDSALEAAIQLATQTDAPVALSYRGDSFGRTREQNRARIAELVANGRVEALMSSQVERIAEGEVTLAVAGARRTLPNDFVIVSVGGELPLEFLASAGVALKKHFEEEAGASKGTIAARRGLAKIDRERKERRTLYVFYFALGLLILAWLTQQGFHYYLLSHAERLRSPLHASLRPAGPFGHGVGIVATVFMLSNFIYAVRKRSRALSGVGSIRGWLDFHMFVGFMSPLVIAFHAAFQSNNQLATGTAGALLVVVLTGIVGRFIYGLVPASGGKEVEFADLLGAWERLRARLLPLIEDSDDPRLLHGLFDELGAQGSQGGSLVALVAALPFRSLRTRLRLFRARAHFDDDVEYRELRESTLRLGRLGLQVRFYPALKQLLRTWRAFHAALAGFLVIAIAAHIGVSLYLGYGWRR